MVGLKKGVTSKVKLAWDSEIMSELETDRMIMIACDDVAYRVKRVAHVFNGKIDKGNPGVCVQVKPEVAKRKVMGI